MSDRESKPKIAWFGERKIVRLMLLAALLTLGVIHFHWLVQGVLFLWHIARPLLVGGAIAYVLEIIIKRLERLYFPRSQKKWVKKSRRWFCILAAAALICFFVALVMVTILPGLTEAFTVLAREFPVYFDAAKKWALERTESFPTIQEKIQNLEFDWQSVQERLLNFAANGLSGLLSSTVTVISAVGTRVFNFVISAIFAVFLLAGKEKLFRQYSRLMAAVCPPEKNEKIQHVFQTAHKAFSGFIVGQSLNGLILGLATWLGMLLFRMPYALMVGVLSGTMALIPIIGGYIGALLGTFLVFTASPGQALWFLLFIVVLQQISGNLIYPRLVGTSVGLPSLWVLAAVTVGGGLGGIGGMLAGVPLAATLYVLMQEWLRRKERKAVEAGE